MLSPLIGIPLAAMMLILLAGHILALQDCDQPALRKRIRSANGVLFMLMTCLGYAGMCWFTTEESPREWALTWMAIMMIVSVSVLLAMTDALYTAVLRRKAISQVRKVTKTLREELIELGVRLDAESVDIPVE